MSNKKETNRISSVWDHLDAIVIGIILIIVAGIASITHEEPVKEEFKVTTKFGETYKIKTSHHCGKHLRKAANQTFGIQDAKLKKKMPKMLLTVVRDLTYIYDGKIKEANRCKINLLTAKRLT